MVEIISESMDEHANAQTAEAAADVIHFLGENSPGADPDLPQIIEVSTLNQCFNAVLLRRKVRISFAAYESMVQNDLDVSEIAVMNECEKAVLAKCLNFFMTQWPGWTQRLTFSDGPTPIATWYNDYKAFLKDRVMYIVNNMESLWEDAIAMYDRENLLKTEGIVVNGETNAQDKVVESEVKPERGVQTDSFDFAPYHLAFSGQLAVLNSLYFVKTKEGKLAARFHEPIKLETVSAKQLLNFPYICVNVTLPEISFGRKVDHNYTRFITIKALRKSPPSIEKKVQCIKRMDVDKYDTSVYSYEFIKEYFLQFFYLIRNHMLIVEERVAEMEAIAEEFLKDVADCNLYDNTMATNMSVTYRISGHTYIRNKTWRQGKYGTVSYVERIVPRSTFFLKSFSAIQDASTGEPTFTLLNKVDRAIRNREMDNADLTQFLLQLRDTENSISYSCTLCEKVFSYYQLLHKHYRLQHGGEQAVLCDVCGAKQNMLALLSRRWEHRCHERLKHEPADITRIPAPCDLDACTDDSSRSGVGCFVTMFQPIKQEEKTEDPTMGVMEVEEAIANGIAN